MPKCQHKHYARRGPHNVTFILLTQDVTMETSVSVDRRKISGVLFCSLLKKKIVSIASKQKKTTKKHPFLNDVIFCYPIIQSPKLGQQQKKKKKNDIYSLSAMFSGDHFKRIPSNGLNNWISLLQLRKKKKITLALQQKQSNQTSKMSLHNCRSVKGGFR